MRDIALAIFVAIITPLGLFHPWMGIMGWAFVSLFSPHRLAWGFMNDAPVAALTGGATLLGLLFSKDPKRLAIKGPMIWLAIFTVWMVITYPFSLDRYSGINEWELSRVLKIMLMTFVAVMVISTRRQINILIAVCVFSIGFYGVKGGIFTILTGGAYHVRQGLGGFISGNNEIGLAMVMTVPLIFYLRSIAKKKWVQMALLGCAVLTSVAILGTQSRGAFVAIAAMGLALLFRSPKRGQALVPVLIIAVFVPFFMPDSWWARMGTISTYEQDASAMGRINAWTLAWNVATHNFFGGGFYLESGEIFARYAPDPQVIAVAHSIYFQVLGQHGFVGLLLFLGFWISTWRTVLWVSKNALSQSDKMLARMIEVSLVGYATGGAFLNLAYFDGPYYLMAALVVLRYKLMNDVPASNTSTAVAKAFHST